MKKIFTKSLMAIAFLFAAGWANAQTLEETIVKYLPGIDMSKSANELMGTMAQFDLAADQYPDQWAAQYYAAFCKVTVSHKLEGIPQKDQVLDEADAYLAKAKTLGPDKSETYVLAAMIANARLAVDGQNRWMKYGPIFNENIEKAKSLNADNPRAYYLQGTGLFYTPEQFGGGAKAALPYFEKAKGLFEKESKASVLEPFWGTEPNAYFISECTKPADQAAPAAGGDKPKKEKKAKKSKGA